MPARRVLLPVCAVLSWAIEAAPQDSPIPSPATANPALPPGAIARLGTPAPPGTWVRVRAVAFSPDGKTLASAETSGTIRLWNTTTRKETRQIDSQQSDVSGIAFSPDGRVLASGDWNMNTILTWDVSSGKEWHKFEGPAKCVNGLAFSPDGRLLASTHNDYSICLWDFTTGAALRTIPNETHSRIPAFSPDGKRLAARGDRERVIRIWDVDTGNPIVSFPS